jgi:hypothetical protein
MGSSDPAAELTLHQHCLFCRQKLPSLDKKLDDKNLISFLCKYFDVDLSEFKVNYNDRIGDDDEGATKEAEFTSTESNAAASTTITGGSGVDMSIPSPPPLSFPLCTQCHGDLIIRLETIYLLLQDVKSQLKEVLANIKVKVVESEPDKEPLSSCSSKVLNNFDLLRSRIVKSDIFIGKLKGGMGWVIFKQVSNKVYNEVQLILLDGQSVNLKRHKKKSRMDNKRLGDTSRIELSDASISERCTTDSSIALKCETKIKTEVEDENVLESDAIDVKVEPEEEAFFKGVSNKSSGDEEKDGFDEWKDCPVVSASNDRVLDEVHPTKIGRSKFAGSDNDSDIDSLAIRPERNEKVEDTTGVPKRSLRRRFRRFVIVPDKLLVSSAGSISSEEDDNRIANDSDTTTSDDEGDVSWAEDTDGALIEEPVAKKKKKSVRTTVGKRRNK